jgi:hypothetical protein
VAGSYEYGDEPSGYRASGQLLSPNRGTIQTCIRSLQEPRKSGGAMCQRYTNLENCLYKSHKDNTFALVTDKEALNQINL